MFQKVFLRLTRARRFRSGIIALCAIGAIVLVAVGSSPLLANPGTVTMRVDPVRQVVPVNETFTVGIVANNVDTEMNPEGLGAYEFDLVYDSDYLEVDSAGDAGELDDTERTVNELGPNIDNGRTTFAAYSHPPVDANGPVSPTVALATVTLQAKRAGWATLDLENPLLTDTLADAWPDEGAGRYLSVSSAQVFNTIDAFFHWADYDGDGTDDPAVWHPQWNHFYFLESGSGDAIANIWLGWGADSIPVPGDYNGDGKTDPAVWRPSSYKWFIQMSDPASPPPAGNLDAAGYYQFTQKWLGWQGVVPVPGDYDGDGIDDPAVWHPQWNRFYFLESGSGDAIANIWLGWGVDSIPVPSDYNGDGKTDPAVWRPSSYKWYIQMSDPASPPPAGNLDAAGYYQFTQKWLGWTGVVPVPGDYDGDGIDDPAVWHPQWNRFYFLESGSGDAIANIWLGWGVDSIPVPGDYNGDGRTDPAVWRPSSYKWFIQMSDPASPPPAGNLDAAGYYQFTQKWLGWEGVVPVK